MAQHDRSPVCEEHTLAHDSYTRFTGCQRLKDLRDLAQLDGLGAVIQLVYEMAYMSGRLDAQTEEW